MTTTLDNLYQDVILDYARRRAGFGILEHPQARHLGHNPHCGDEILVQLAVNPASGLTEALRWTGSGCVISQASASALSEVAAGKTLEDLGRTIDVFRHMMRSRGEVSPDYDVLGDARVFHDVSRYLMRIPCALLAWTAARECVADLARPGNGVNR